MREREAKKGRRRLARGVGLPGGLAIGLGTMMAAGVFVLSADAASRAGPGAALTYLLAGLIALPIAMALAELMTAMPMEGGSHYVIARVLGPLAGGIVGPANWIGLIFATGFYLIGLAQYVGFFTGMPPWMVTLAAGAAFTVLNVLSGRITSLVEAIVVGLVLALLAYFVISGLGAVQASHHDPFVPEGWGVIVGSVGLVIVAFTGFEKVSAVAGEIKKPMVNLPRAIIGSVVIAIVIYMGVLYVMTGVLPYGHFNGTETPLVDAAQGFLGPSGGIALAVGGLLATASSINAEIMSASRVAYALGRDSMIPAWFGTVNGRFHTPVNAIVVTGSAATALSLVGNIEMLAEVGSTLFMVSFALLALGVILINRKQPEWYDPAYHVPLKPWLPAAAGIAALLVILTMNRFSQITGLGLAALSLVWYWLWARKRTDVRGEIDLFH